MKRRIQIYWIISAIAVLPFIYGVSVFVDSIFNNADTSALMAAIVAIIGFVISFFCLWNGKKRQEHYNEKPVNDFIRMAIVIYTAIAGLLVMMIALPIALLAFNAVGLLW